MKRGCHEGIETFIVRVGGRRKRIWPKICCPCVANCLGAMRLVQIPVNTMRELSPFARHPIPGRA